MKTPAVSILIPTYNYARYLPEAIESVLAQDFTDFELLIADDASSDNTVDVCEAYAANDSRIRFVRHEKNLGMVENWNWCLRQARGCYIKYMLADDKFLRPYALSRLVESIEKRPGISLVTSARALMDADSKITGVWNPLGLLDRRYRGSKLSVQCLERSANRIGEPTAVIFRKADAVRGFDVTFRQLVDLEMWLHLLQAGDLFYLAESLCCFRQHAEQQTVVNRKDALHLRELIRLGKYMPKRQARRMWFCWIYRMKKCDRSVYAERIELLNENFSPLVYGFSWLEYRLIRPFQNLQNSLRKRVGKFL